SQPPFSKGRRNISPFEKGGLRGIFEAPFSGRLALFKQLKCYNISNFSQADTNIQIGNMIRNTASTFRPFNLGTSARRDFNIFFSARNGLFTQLLRMRKVDGKWFYATKVQKQDKVIFEKIDDKFPRNDIGEIEWQ
ncbi:MAG: hypothetical protein AB1744_00530, partial [Candidatus Zixiibacteriota bacterium]